MCGGEPDELMKRERRARITRRIQVISTMTEMWDHFRIEKRTPQFRSAKVTKMARQNQHTWRKHHDHASRPDPTFHATAKLAMEAPVENYAYTLMLSPDFSKPDALAVIDVNPASDDYGTIVHTVTMPNKGDEFHHFGWNACSSALSPLTGHAFLECRYLIIPGLRSSRIYIVDTNPHPTQAKIHKIIEPEEVFRKTGYSRPHTVHCGPEGIYLSALWAALEATAPMDLRASSLWIVRLSMFSAVGKSIGDRKSFTMISGGTCPATTW